MAIDGLSANIIGMMGGALILIGYGYNVYAEHPKGFIYNGVNFFGAIFLVISLWVHFNLASLILNIIWIGIAIFGLWKAYRAGQGSR